MGIPYRAAVPRLMANKQGQQGTRWESRIRNEAQAQGKTARRLAKRGVSGEPDVEIEGTEGYIPAVYWEHWRKGKTRRSAKRVVIVDYETWKKLFDNSEAPTILVQAKSTERLNVTKTLEELESAIEQIGEWT